MTIDVLKRGPMQRAICVVLAVSMASAPSMNLPAQTNDAAQKAAPNAAAAKVDTTYLTPGAAALVVLRPAQLMKSPMSELLPVEVATAAGVKYLGIDPANVEEASGFIDLSNPTAPPNYGVSIKFIQPVAGFNPPPELRAHTQSDQLAGKPYLKSQLPVLPSFFAPDGRTLLVAPDSTLKKLVESPEGSKAGPIIDRVRNVPGGNDLYVAVDVARLRPLIQMRLAQSRANMLPNLRPIVEAIDLISAAELTVNLSKAAPSSLVVHANDEAAAQRIEELVAEAAAKYREKMKAQFARQAASEDPVERAFAQYMERVSGRWSQPMLPTREGTRLTFFRIEGTTSPQQQLTAVAIIGILVALLLPATQAAREAARRTQSQNNLRQMILGLMNFHDTKRSFPAHAIYSPDGKPLLSWRVQILPYIDELPLYKELHLDEPWDSEHNRGLLARMPKLFQNASVVLPPGKTNYLAVVGKECIFDGTATGMSLQKITDGTSHTIMLVEADANKAVEWTKPDDLNYDPNNPTAGLGHLRPTGWLAAFADGHVQFITTGIDQNELKAMFTRAGREKLNFDLNSFR